MRTQAIYTIQAHKHMYSKDNSIDLGRYTNIGVQAPVLDKTSQYLLTRWQIHVYKHQHNTNMRTQARYMCIVIPIRFKTILVLITTVQY